ncbi:MAG: ABC transporter permease [Candidatus Omnitrophica bacterium]|nr:ABC transporter permease [Candidatus Omnitrophota bacterium]
MLLIKLAFLNIGRNPRRSLITVLAVGVGLATLIFLWGFSDGTADEMRENVIRLFTGHIQIHAHGFEKSLSPELTLPDRLGLIEKIKAGPGVQSVTERVKCEALIGTTEHSRGILLMGVDPVQESEVTELEKHIRKGEFLSPQGNRELLIGDRLAEKLHLEIGDKAVVMTQAIDGTLAGFAYRVKGVFHTGSQQVDEMTAYITLAAGQELLSMGEETHELVIQLVDRESIPSFLATAKGMLDRETYEMFPWYEVVPEPELWLKWYEAIMRVVLVAVMVVIGVSIMNTVLMSVFERMRELGVMMAIGTSPRQIINLVLLETLVLEFFGIILGLILGYLVVFYFGKVGISFHELEEALSQSYVSTVTYTHVHPGHVLESVITLLIISSFISLYPAWKAGHMEPVKAIYRT